MDSKLTVLLALILALGGVAYWQETRGPVATIDPTPTQKRWTEVGKMTALDTSFQVRGWLAFSAAAGAMVPHDVRVTIAGEFAADSPALLLLMDDKNFKRLRSGYPPLPFASFKPGSVKADAPGGKTWLVFCQKPAESGAEPFPLTGLQLGLALLKRLQESNAPPAHVTVHLDSIFSVYATPSDAAALRAKFRTASASAQQKAPLPPDRTLPARPAQALPLSLPRLGTGPASAPGGHAAAHPTDATKLAEPNLTLHPGPQM